MPTQAASAPSSARTSGATIAGKVFPTEAKVCCPNIAASAISIGDTSGLGLAVSAIAAKEQMFHVFDDDQIRGRDNDKRDNDFGRQRHETEPCAGRGKRRGDSQNNDAERAEGESRMRPTEPRSRPRPYEEDHQYLGHQRFNEPARLEQRLGGTEAPEQNTERQEVEQRADRAKNEHEVAYEIDIPMARTGDHLGIHIVQRNGDLGGI